MIPRRPASSRLAIVSMSSSLDPNDGPAKPVRPQAHEKTLAKSGMRPAAFVLDDNARALYRRWLQGKRIRQLARNHGTTVEDMEDILRRVA